MPSPLAHALARAAALVRRRPGLADALLVVGLLLVALLPGRFGDLANATDARLFSLGLILPLLGRRRWPVPVFGLVCAVAAGQWLADVRAVGDGAMLVALYGVAVSQPVRTTAVAVGVVETGIVLAVARWGVSEGEGGFQPAIGLSAMCIAAAVMGTSTRNRRALVASLEERAERLQAERDQQGRLAAAAERARIAREMHDIVAHNVSVMIALSDGAGFAVHDDPGRAELAMQRASDTGRKALTEMRRLLGVLRDDEGEHQRAPQPGLAALDALLEQVRTAGLPVRYATSGELGDLPAGLQLATYRVVQEALTNALKHAGPGASAQVSVDHAPERLQIDVVDRGGSAAPGPIGEGGGLRGMRERAAVYDGEVEAGPTPDGGWRVRITVPLDRAMATT